MNNLWGLENDLRKDKDDTVKLCFSGVPSNTPFG
jgi:hypothetical protein